MLTATCHCGAVRVEVPRKPRTLTACNCSICVRYGTLWAYYRRSAIRVIAGRGATEAYAWNRKSIRFVRCRTCGCVTHYERTSKKARYGAVNARGFPLDVLESIRVRRLDGAKTWKYLD
jgi:hypothetical protein